MCFIICLYLPKMFGLVCCCPGKNVHVFPVHKYVIPAIIASLSFNKNLDTLYLWTCELQSCSWKPGSSKCSWSPQLLDIWKRKLIPGNLQSQIIGTLIPPPVAPGYGQWWHLGPPHHLGRCAIEFSFRPPNSPLCSHASISVQQDAYFHVIIQPQHYKQHHFMISQHDFQYCVLLFSFSPASHVFTKCMVVVAASFRLKK